MILDDLTHWRHYAAISPRFKPAFEYLSTFDAGTALGRHDIDADNVFALVQKYTTKPLEGAQFEAHRKYIDIQFVFSGRESILWAPLSAMKTVNMAFDVSQDAALYALVPEQTELHVGSGQFALLFPEDAHSPCRVWGAPSDVHKVVVKVRV